MSKKEDELIGALSDQVAELSAQIEELKKIDLDVLLSSGRKTTSGGRAKKDHRPEWVLKYEQQNHRNSPVQHVVKTHENGEVEKLLPVVIEPVKPHEVSWPGRPTTNTVAPRGLTNREAVAYEAVGGELELRDEGPTKPMRKQMLMMNKVWKYRNFKKCSHCGAFDTWESRTDPWAEDKFGPRPTHSEIWCQTCSATDLEVSDNLPAHIGSWAPPKVTEKEKLQSAARKRYRWERTIFALVQSPKTAAELCVWFRTVENYKAVDFIMLELQLKQMAIHGLVVRVDGKWWDAADYAFERAGK